MNIDNKFVGTYVSVSENQDLNNVLLVFNRLVKNHRVKRLTKLFFVSRGEKNRKKGYRKRILLKQKARRRMKSRGIIV